MSLSVGGGEKKTVAKGRRRAASFVVNDATNVRVFVRVRPFNKREVAMNEDRPIVHFDEKHVTTINPETFVMEEHVYQFDNCFWSMKEGGPRFWGQEDIYHEVGPIILDNVFQGYNACLFAYGQTGAGKSYTMMGSVSEPEQWGIIPRLTQGLFSRMKEETTGREYNVKVSYIEIYCEQLRDLLGSKGAKFNDIRVRDHPKYGPYIDGANMPICQNLEDVQKCLRKGDGNRVVASTNMNDVSSRSHAVFCVIFEQFKTENGKTRSWLSKINLVDLAGSERVSLTGAEGQTFEEGKKINLSLTILGRVIDCLVELSEGKKGVIPPYRDSMLTRVLQDSLGGNSKTMMFANISPAACNYGDSVNTLQYASRARKIVNKAHVNTDSSGAMIDNLNAELEALKAQLANASGSGSAEQEEEINHLTDQLQAQNDLISRLKGSAEEMEQVKAETEAAKSEISQLTSKLEDFDQVKSELGSTTDQLAQKSQQLDDMSDKLEQTKRQMTQSNNEYDKRCKKLESDLAECKSHGKKLEGNIADKEKKLNQTQDDLDATRRELEAKKTESANRSRDIDDLKNDLRDKERQNEDANMQLSDAWKENGDLQSALKKYRTKFEDAQEEKNRLKDQTEKYTSEIAVLKKQLERERTDRRSTEGRLDSERRRAGDFLSNLANLEEQVHKMNVREVNFAERSLSPERKQDRQNGVNSCIANQKELIKQLQREKQDLTDNLYGSLREIEDAIRNKEYDRCQKILMDMRRRSGGGGGGGGGGRGGYSAVESL